jgi:hypothetical protein
MLLQEEYRARVVEEARRRLLEEHAAMLKEHLPKVCVVVVWTFVIRRMTRVLLLLLVYDVRGAPGRFEIGRRFAFHQVIRLEPDDTLAPLHAFPLQCALCL